MSGSEVTAETKAEWQLRETHVDKNISSYYEKFENYTYMSAAYSIFMFDNWKCQILSNLDI